MGLRKVYVIGKLIRTSVSEPVYVDGRYRGDIKTRYTYSPDDMRQCFSFQERMPGSPIEKSHLKAFGTLEEAEEYVQQTIQRDRGTHCRTFGFTPTGSASAIFHVNVAEADLPTIDFTVSTFGDRSYDAPPYKVLDLHRRNIISIDCATFNIDELHHNLLISPEMKKTDLRPQQQSKYEEIAKAASDWRAACHNMIRAYRGKWYTWRTHRHLADQIERVLNAPSTPSSVLEVLLSRLQQHVPHESWNNDFCGLITAMREMLHTRGVIKREELDATLKTPEYKEEKPAASPTLFKAAAAHPSFVSKSELTQPLLTDAAPTSVAPR